jgi:hypothetical protein
MGGMHQSWIVNKGEMPKQKGGREVGGGGCQQNWRVRGPPKDSVHLLNPTTNKTGARCKTHSILALSTEPDVRY